MFYQKLLSLCSERGIRITSLISELHISSGNLSKWKAGNNPKSDTLLKIADYFNVTTDYLLGKEEESERTEVFSPERLQEAMGGMSCEELAEKFDGSAKIISLYLDGKRKPSKATLHLMAIYLGVNPEWLYGLDGVPKYKNPAPADVDDILSALIHNFEQLNREGRERLVETSDDMVSSGKYIKSDRNQLGKAKDA